MLDRIFAKNGISIDEETLTDIWLEDQYTSLKFEQWAKAKGYIVTSGGGENDK